MHPMTFVERIERFPHRDREMSWLRSRQEAFAAPMSTPTSMEESAHTLCANRLFSATNPQASSSRWERAWTKAELANGSLSNRAYPMAYACAGYLAYPF